MDKDFERDVWLDSIQQMVNDSRTILDQSDLTPETKTIPVSAESVSNHTRSLTDRSDRIKICEISFTARTVG